MLLWVDGKPQDAQQATVPLLSDAFMFGHGVFETLRTYHGQIFRLDDHLDRLFESAEGMRIEPVFDRNQITEQLQLMLRGVTWQESRIKVVLIANHMMILMQSLEEKPDSYYQKGIHLARFEGERPLPTLKKIGDSLCFMANQHAKKKGVYDSILVGHQEQVRECSYANLFWVKAGQLFTPEEGVLHGITRQTVIDLAESCLLSSIRYSELLQADEVFITQTSSGILPVVQIEDRQIGQGVPGPITSQLMEKFRENVKL